MRFAETQIIAVANQKGGCGKTTGSVSLAAGFTSEGYSACVVDTDPQANASLGLGVRQDWLQSERRRTVADIYLAKAPATEVLIDFPPERFGGNLALVPGHSGLFVVDRRLENEIHTRLGGDDPSLLDQDEVRDEQRFRLKKSLDSLRGRFDLVIIDTPPSLGFLMTTALIAADWLLIPVRPSGYDLDGLEKLLETMCKVRDKYNPKLRLAGVVLGDYNKRANLHRDVHQMLRERFGAGLVFGTTISHTVRHEEATFRGLTIFEHAPEEPAARDYLALVRELLSRGQRADAPRASALNEQGEQELEMAHG